MKKILINCCLLNPRKRGMAVYLENILQELNGLENYELILIVKNKFALDLISNMSKNNFIPIKVSAPLVLVEQFIIPFLLLIYKPVLYINSGNTATLVSFGVRYILLMHDISFTKPSSMVPSSNSLKRKLGKIYRKTLVSLKIKKAFHLITVSEFASKDIQQQYSIPQNKLSVVPNGIAPEFIFGKISRSLENRVRRVVFITGSDEQKNMRRTLSALKSCYNNKKFDLETVVVGINRDIYGYDFGPKVKFIGYQDNKKLPMLLANSEFFMLPSLYESFGIPALEAYSSGCQLYLSKLGALNSIFGNRAVYFDPWEQEDIERAFYDMNARPINEGHSNVDDHFTQEYLWKNSADKLSQLIKDLA